MNILKNAKQLLFSDGDICDNSISLMEILERNAIKYVKNSVKINKGVRCYRQHNFLNLIDKMKDDINNDVYFTVSCNTKAMADKIKHLILP